MPGITALLLAAAFAQGTLAGWARSIQCSTDGHATKWGAGQGQATSLNVHFEYNDDECPDSTIRHFDAYTGNIAGILGFREFCGGKGGDGTEHDKRFCGNIDVFPRPGLHISLDGHDVNLGKADEVQDLPWDAASTKATCESINFHTDDPYNSDTSITTYHDVAMPCV